MIIKVTFLFTLNQINVITILLIAQRVKLAFHLYDFINALKKLFLSLRKFRYAQKNSFYSHRNWSGRHNYL